MKYIRSAAALLLAAAMLLSMTGCLDARKEPELSLPTETTQPETEPETVPETTEETQPQWTPFTGTDYNYVYYYEDGREREWEEDIIYMASNYIDDYAAVSRFPFRIEWPDDVEYSDQFFDPELQQYWIDETNDMIMDIPNMTDLEIHYRIQKLVATLGDAHASVYLPKSDYFPICFYPFRTRHGLDIRVVGLPAVHEDMLFSKLYSVNGYTVDQIIEMLRPYISHENEAWLVGSIFAINGSSFIIWEDYLKMAGIMEPDAETVTYTMLSDTSRMLKLELEAVSNLDLSGYTGQLPTHVNTYMYKDADTKNYWFERLPTNNMIYVRINRFQEQEGYSFLTMGNEILKDVRDNGGYIGKLVVDLRDNPGGYTFAGYHEFVKVLQRVEIGTVYVLVDFNTFSNGIIMAGTIKRMIPDSIIVGTPAGQPPNFFAGMSDGDYTMPNSGTIIRMPTAYNVSLPDYEGDTLMPDIVIYPKIELYMIGVDTILEQVKGMP